MAPPRVSTTPLLSELDPQAVAADVVRLVIEHLHVTGDPSETTEIGATAHALALYAQRGLPVWDWTDHGCASDACLSLFSALYSRAAGEQLGGGITDLPDDLEPDDAIGVVLLAALARIRIDQGADVALRELAVLSGLSRRQLQHLAASGEIEATDGRVEAADATRWLAARGVPGFGQPSGNPG